MVRRKLWRAAVAHSPGVVAGALVLRRGRPRPLRIVQGTGPGQHLGVQPRAGASAARPPFVPMAGAARRVSPLAGPSCRAAT